MLTTNEIEHLALIMMSKKKSKRRPRSWATLDEANILCEHIINHKITTVIEIGTANGFTAACMASTGIKVLTFDLVDTPKMYQDEPELCALIDFKAIPSPECFQFFNLPKGPVLFFVDGPNENGAREADFKRCQEIARPGDIIAMHDIVKDPWDAFWNSIAETFPNSTTTFITSNGLGILNVS